MPWTLDIMCLFRLSSIFLSTITFLASTAPSARICENSARPPMNDPLSVEMLVLTLPEVHLLAGMATITQLVEYFGSYGNDANIPVGRTLPTGNRLP
jgi:hypothetical protein